MPENEAVTETAAFLAVVQEACASADKLIGLNQIAIRELANIPGIPAESFEFANETIGTLTILKMLVTKLTEHSLEVDDVLSDIRTKVEENLKKD